MRTGAKLTEAFPKRPRAIERRPLLISANPVDPATVRDVLAATLIAAGLDVVKFHTLRHTAALLLTDGTPLFDVGRILGHAQVSMTADIYGDLVPEMTAGAASRMDTLLKAKGK